MKILHHQEGRDHTAAEQHGEDHHQLDGLAEVQISSGHGISHQTGEDQVDEGTHHRNKDGDQQASHQGAGGENKLIGA
ncbi:hypothetical protein D3C75_870530 [compost metagenome]